MTYTVIENITIRTSKGDYPLLPGKRIELSVDAATRLLKTGKITSETEAHRATLEVVMGDMVQATCDRIIEEHRKRGIASYKSTPENQWAEMEITRIYHAVLDGRADIDDFKQACENWLNPISSFKAISKITGGGNETK
jgi:hypothetical protein